MGCQLYLFFTKMKFILSCSYLLYFMCMIMGKSADLVLCAFGLWYIAYIISM